MGKIFRFAWVENQNYILIFMKNNVPEKYFFEKSETIVKHSNNLIDLIENEDVLTINLSEEFVEGEDRDLKIIVGKQHFHTNDIKRDLENGLYKILEVLTHEQYEDNCYKVN